MSTVTTIEEPVTRQRDSETRPKIELVVGTGMHLTVSLQPWPHSSNKDGSLISFGARKPFDHGVPAGYVAGSLQVDRGSLLKFCKAVIEAERLRFIADETRFAQGLVRESRFPSTG
jgi:hypothetical protein